MILDPLIRDNLRLLEQGLDLVATLPPSAYADSRDALSGASIGAHLRHVLDHYTGLLRGLHAGVVDYEDRDRDARIEVDPTHARTVARDLMEGLGELQGLPDVGLALALHAGRCAEQDLGTSPTGLARELQFALLHTVHHYAIIKMELVRKGIVCPPDFGLAPATLGYRQASA